MFNPMILATAGWSEAVEVRSRRFLGFEAGVEARGAPVTMATVLARLERDPVASARHLMLLPPLSAVDAVTAMLSQTSIDGEPCPDPDGVARAALAHAGRVVSLDDAHPERRVVAKVVAVLKRGRRGH